MKSDKRVKGTSGESRLVCWLHCIYTLLEKYGSNGTFYGSSVMAVAEPSTVPSIYPFLFISKNRLCFNGSI